MKLSTLLSAFLVCTPFALALVATPTVVEAADASKVLEKLDKDAEVFADVSYVASMDVYKGGTKKKTLQFNMVMKGLDRQYIEFTAPGDVAGMKILMSFDNMWMYSPEFKKVRKVAAHTESQGFLGSEFRTEDMTMARLASRFDAQLVGQSGNETTLTLTPKPEAQVSYPRVDIIIDRTKGGVTKMIYFDGSGAAIREQHREGWTKIKGERMPTKITMKNLKTGAETVINMSGLKVDQGVDDGLFSKRTLLR
ncbi:outer membrane lipoprotein-sorting protein [Pseudenhygromyxa sp. WMMC2535]|uniref:outer membrane lipoprotein-sorting protein n=1 Tax=Pseudenhygromyxa sp. WMMC2535 TaxID=2712867 RepID=UPI001553CA44|nr:outer membrane lipoprotein-sorting protein [Pseudenhygromyxa sp. WMMC2535]NVB36294.1 outer membrane lipoprotein-sorting protein [Pseudenhygromyxa sp. WMMC2535]